MHAAQGVVLHMNVGADIGILFELRCLNSAVSLTLVKEQRFIRILLLLSLSHIC